MLVILVEWEVLPGQEAAFAARVAAQAADSLAKEPACRRFDVARAEDDPALFLLYEIYDDAAAFHAHRETPHFHDFDVTVAPMTKSKRVRRFTLAG